MIKAKEDKEKVNNTKVHKQNVIICTNVDKAKANKEKVDKTKVVKEKVANVNVDIETVDNNFATHHCNQFTRTNNCLAVI